MKIKINDKGFNVESGTTVGQMMTMQGIEPKGIAVALNGKLVAAAQWNETVLTDGDSLVVIKAFYGG